MNWRPDHVRATSLSDFATSFDGWTMVNCPTPDGPDYSDEELARLDAIVEDERVKMWQRQGV
jgi:hypothetical protein